MSSSIYKATAIPDPITLSSQCAWYVKPFKCVLFILSVGTVCLTSIPGWLELAGLHPSAFSTFFLCLSSIPSYSTCPFPFSIPFLLPSFCLPPHSVTLPQKRIQIDPYSSLHFVCAICTCVAAALCPVHLPPTWAIPIPSQPSFPAFPTLPFPSSPCGVGSGGGVVTVQPSHPRHPCFSFGSAWELEGTHAACFWTSFMALCMGGGG